jgi:hypothetical protein
MKQSIRVVICMALGAVSIPAFACKGGPPPPPPTITLVEVGDREVSEDEFFVGINWQFGAASQAELVIGYRDVDVETNGDVSGAGVDMTFPLKDGIHVGELRFKGIEGEDDLQGEFGLGWSFFHKGFLLTAAAQGPYVTLGADFVFGTGFEPYIGVNTISDYDPPDFEIVEERSCPQPFTLSPDGQSCLGGGSPPSE